jgi:hypothetical protein
MADVTAISATGNAILRLLDNAYSKAGIEEKANFALYQATDFQSPPDFANKEMGISLLVYRIGIDGTRRNLSGRLSPEGYRDRPALPLIVYFMLTPWAFKAETRLWLLGWAMRVLEDTPILPSGLLNPPGSAAPPFRPDETVELVFDPLSMADLGLLWENLKQPRIIPSVTYLARIVQIETSVKEARYPLVQTREARMAKAEVR